MAEVGGCRIGPSAAEPEFQLLPTVVAASCRCSGSSTLASRLLLQVSRRESVTMVGSVDTKNGM